MVRLCLYGLYGRQGTSDVNYTIKTYFNNYAQDDIHYTTFKSTYNSLITDSEG